MVYSDRDDVLIVSTFGRGVFKCSNFKELFNKNVQAKYKTPYAITPNNYKDVITTTGQVGIGLLEPKTKMHVSDNANVLRLQGSDHVFMEFYPDGGDTRGSYIG